MTPRVAAVVPVKDGARYLAEVLAALAREAVDEVLVIDSGSRDGSVEIARGAGVEVLEIAPADFGHGRTRNLGAERTSAEIVAFLTQDATPVPGWRAALDEAFAADPRIGAAFGPHLPRPDTSPMIARELTEFFATFAGVGDAPRVFAGDEPTFLSNVDAAYRRACWEELRFDDVPYSEDQAFGRALAAHPAWRKAYVPRAGVLHAHDYPPVEFMRRYFDEYRGLRETIGHVERIGARSTVRDVRGLVASDRRWMREQGMPATTVTRWTGRSLVHHTGRKVFSALGSRSSRLPAPVQSALSLEGRADGGAPEIAAPPVPDLPATKHQPPRHAAHGYEAIVRVMGSGAAPLLDPVPGMADRERLHVAFAIPPFSIGSGGHSIIFQLVLWLERMGHTCSIWLHDPFSHMHGGGPTLRGTVVEHFAPVRAPVFRGFGDWYGADVAVASGWQTVFPLLEQQGVRARAYLINDHEPEFYPTSVESIWAKETYRQGLYGIAGSPWLRDLYIDRYGGAAEAFQYGVDHDVYYPRPVPRRDDTIVFYARSVTSRRAVALGVMALARVKARRPDVRIVLFGDREPLHTSFPYEHIGVATPEQLAWVYSEATVGVCLSLTNYSLIPQEMLACGLPCVDLEGASASSVFGADGPVELVPFDADRLAGALERLLDDRAERGRRSAAGRDFVRPHTWDRAAVQVERGLRSALRVRGGMTTAATRSPAADAVGPEQTPRARRRPPPALVSLLAATFVLAIAWALVTPAFQAPDEQSHFGYVQSLVEGPGLPGKAGRPLFSSEQALAASQSNADQAAAQPSVKMEWSPLVYARWRAADAALPDGSRSNGGGPNPAASNPPLYYFVEVPAYAAARGGDVFDQLLAMRILSLLWLLVTVTSVWLLAGEVFGRDRLLQLAAASLAGLAPMMTFLSASVTPDAMMYALWSLVLWLGVRILRRGLTWQLALALFALAGAAGCVKATSYALIPAALFVLAVGLWRRRPRQVAAAIASAGAAAAGLALTLGVWKLVANAMERVTSAQFSAATSTEGVLNVRMLLSYVWQFYLPRLPFQDDFAFPGPTVLPLDSIWLQGAWGSFGWLEVDFPPLVYDVLIAATAIVVVAAGTTLWRTRRTTDWAVAVFFAGLTVTLLAGLHWTEFQLISRGGGTLNQGRYLLPLAGLAGLCVAQALRLLPPRLRPYGVGVLTGGLLALQLLALALMTDRYFA